MAYQCGISGFMLGKKEKVYSGAYEMDGQEEDRFLVGAMLDGTLPIVDSECELCRQAFIMEELMAMEAEEG